MKILVDTSVWSLLLRRKKEGPFHPLALFLQRKIEEEAPLFMAGIIFQETLQGIRSETQFHAIRKCLVDFPFLETTQEVHERAAVLFNEGRKKGISSHTADCLIAAHCLHHECQLLTADKDFHEMKRFAPLDIIYV